MASKSGCRAAATRTFHPSLPVLYVNNELDSTVTVFAWDTVSGQATESQVISTISGTDTPGTQHDSRNRPPARVAVIFTFRTAVRTASFCFG